ncbi:oxygen-insensitive NADPH nitroreductase [Escherichia coli STEC_S1191]|nr:oxygen-insensitive NADPH nitroreductase [Escherichia coli STEC_S1191]
MTPTIELICGHRSIRHFTDEPISEAQREAIINSARATSSSSFLQCSSIIRITDKALREELVTLTGGQKHVAQAAEFWVFCADFNRHLQICPDAQLGLAEQLLLGVVDTAMMAQNALIAAESLGLGGVYIGGLRIIRILSRVYRPPFWCMKTAINRWIKAHWRSMTSNWRNITSPVAAIIAGIPGAIISAEQSLKKAAHLFWIICTNRVGRRAKTATSMYDTRAFDQV